VVKALRYKPAGRGFDLWGWLKGRVAVMRRMDPKWIEDDCLLRPQFHLWPPRRHKAVLWTLAMYVTFRSGHERRSLGELRDYIKEHLWKLYQMKDRQTLVGNCLSLLLEQVGYATIRDAVMPVSHL
jgi:hypothetical protein